MSLSMKQWPAMRLRPKGTIYSPRACERCRRLWTPRLLRQPWRVLHALDHVLDDESLWPGSHYAGEVFLRELIKAARGYIIRAAR